MINKYILIIGGVALLAILYATTPPFLQANAETSFKVKDGDSFYLGDDEIRLWGIDAPEFFQKCDDGAGAEYPCGRNRSTINLLKDLQQNKLVKTIY